MSSARRVLLRAHGGARVGMGHVMRTRAVAEAVRARGGEPLLVVGDEESAARLRAEGFEAESVLARPAWASERAAGAWLDGVLDWSAELRSLARRGTPSYLVEHRGVAREWATSVVQPALHFVPDAWERIHAGRVLGGAVWIPLAREVRAARHAGAQRRDLDLLVTFGGSDPLGSTERVLAALPAGLRVAVSVGAHLAPRRGAIERAASQLSAEILPTHSPLAPWMARARAAITALGTTLYELAYLRTPTAILANWPEDRQQLAHYRAHGPFQPIGIAAELDARALERALQELVARPREAPEVPELGEGAERLAERLLGAHVAALAA